MRVSFRSNFGIGDLEFLQVRRHQDRVTQNVAVVHVPQVRQASVFLQRVLRVVGSGDFSGPPNWKLAVSCSLTAWSACKRCASEGSSIPIHSLRSLRSYNKIAFLNLRTGSYFKIWFLNRRKRSLSRKRSPATLRQ